MNKSIDFEKVKSIRLDVFTDKGVIGITSVENIHDMDKERCFSLCVEILTRMFYGNGGKNE